MTAQLEAALAEVEAAAHEEWLIAADVAVERLAMTGESFTSDDVRDLIPSGVTTHEPRALGPVMRRALRDRLIVPVGWTTQGRASAHQRPRRVYVGPPTPGASPAAGPHPAAAPSAQAG